MEYKTIIEIINEAENPAEAADIAGEYLRGNIDYGVRMRCETKPAKYYFIARTALFVFMLVSFIGISSYKINKNLSGIVVPVRNVSAVQPPLKTDTRDEKFVKEWQTKNVK